MFVLTKKQRLHRLECVMATGASFFLTFREMTEEEREQFDHDRAAARDVPGDTEKDRNVRLHLVYAALAAKLLMGWEGIVDEDKKPVPLIDEAKEQFFADPETRKYWRPYLLDYLFPTTRGADAHAEGKQGPDPQS